MTAIPPSIIGTVSLILAEAYTHAQLNALFMAARFPGDAPEGNKIEKCRNWLRRANGECSDPLKMFGALIGEFMDAEPSLWVLDRSGGGDLRERISVALSREGLSYSRGGYIHGASLSGPSRSLAERIKPDGIQAIEIEYDRAYKSIESDPGAAVTAACAILESVCKFYLEEQVLPLPNKQVLGTLWPEVATHLGLSPKAVADDDLKRILQGLYSIGDGVAALRTHERLGSRAVRAQELSPRTPPRAPRSSCRAHHGYVRVGNVGRQKRLVTTERTILGAWQQQFLSEKTLFLEGTSRSRTNRRASPSARGPCCLGYCDAKQHRGQRDTPEHPADSSRSGTTSVWGEGRRWPDHWDVSSSLPSSSSRTGAASRAARNSPMLITSASLNTSPTPM